MKKIVQVLLASLTIGMLASFGVASAEIYMVQFGGFDNSYWLNEVLPMGEENLSVLCNVGDKIIAGSVELPQNLAIIHEDKPVFNQGANSDQEGWKGRIAGQQGPSIVSVWAHCLSPLSMVVGGSLIQPDTTALILAYGIMNSYWMLPTAVGIGLGIYLVKRRF